MSNEKDKGKEKTTNVPNSSEKNDKEEESRNMVRPYFETFSLDDIHIYDKYFPYVRRNLSHGNRVNPDLVESHIKDLTLDEFIVGRKIFCYKNHKKEDLVCKICQPFIDMAAEINSKGIVPLVSLYRKHHSNVAYKSDKATSYVMQLPVCIFKLDKQLFVTELNHAVDMTKFVNFASTLVKPESLSCGIDKNSLKLLCELASSKKDKQLIRVAASTGISAKLAKNELGISELNTERKRVAKAIEDLEHIKSAVNDIIESKQSSALTALDFSSNSSGTKSETDSNAGSEATLNEEQDSENSARQGADSVFEVDNNGRDSTANQHSIQSVDNITKDEPMPSYAPTKEHLLYLLRSNDLNWFAFTEEVRITFTMTEEALGQLFIDFAHFISFTGLTDDEQKLVEQSRQAYLMQQRQKERENELNELHIVTDSESDNPEDWVRIQHAQNAEEIQLKLRKQKAIYSRLRKRLTAKEVVNRRLLKRHIPNRVSRTLKKYPNIGKDIEMFARENRVGADSWRQTGLLTFSGNSKKGAKLTYMRIKDFLEKKYKAKFGYGIIV